jgi:hypothetical protein
MYARLCLRAHTVYPYVKHLCLKTPVAQIYRYRRATCTSHHICHNHAPWRDSRCTHDAWYRATSKTRIMHTMYPRRRSHQKHEQYTQTHTEARPMQACTHRAPIRCAHPRHCACTCARACVSAYACAEQARVRDQEARTCMCMCDGVMRA